MASSLIVADFIGFFWYTNPINRPGRDLWLDVPHYRHSSLFSKENMEGAMIEQTQRVKLNLLMNATNQVVNADTGQPYDLAGVICRLRWRKQGGEREYKPLIHMPPHWYVVLGPDNESDFQVLSFAIRRHPDSYMAYFRGYQTPMRYLELGDGYRYWYTALHGAQMLNRCTLDSVEPPRRVDSGARPICWQEWGAIYYLPQGSGWSEEYRREHPEMFGPGRPPECAHGVIAVGDRVKHLPSRRRGTVISVYPMERGIYVRWDGGKTSLVGKNGLRTQCCLPGESLEVAEAPPESQKEVPPGAGEIHRQFWTQLKQHLENRNSPCRMGSPSNKSIANSIRGPGSFRLTPWNVLSGTSGIGVRFTGPEFDRMAERFQQNRSQVEEKLSPLGQVVWLPKDKSGNILSLRRPSQVSDPASWPELNEWMADAFDRLWALLSALTRGPE
jgi:hypothetical protein